MSDSDHSPPLSPNTSESDHSSQFSTRISIPGTPTPNDEPDSRIEHTTNAVDWDALARKADRPVDHTFSWGEQLSGGYNIVRFLRFHDPLNPDVISTELVARVPFLPIDGPESDPTIGSRLESEVATMEYISKNTQINVPRVISYSSDPKGHGVGSPYILMTKIDGVPLSSLWPEMEDGKREVILKQVIDVLLQLSKLRFDSIGAVMKRGAADQPEFYIAPISNVLTPDDSRTGKEFSTRTYSSAVDYWVAFASSELQDTEEGTFGSGLKTYRYAMSWFLRSIVPSLVDSTLDAKGFPLCPGDFHSQNIMIVDGGTPHPRISGVIDWEFSCTDGMSLFAQYPLFIVDHPHWDDDDPLRLRNARDQKTFDRLMREAEPKIYPHGDFELSRAYENCTGIYLLQQCLQFRAMMMGPLYRTLFELVYGKPGKGKSGETHSGTEDEDADSLNDGDDGGDDDFSLAYYEALMNGILKKKTAQFEFEVTIRQHAVEVLGDEEIPFSMTQREFKEVMAEHKDRFSDDAEVQRWLGDHLLTG